MNAVLSKKDIIGYLREHEISPTAQRVEMAHLLLEKPQHLTADEIFVLVNREFAKASRATIYNNLHLFVKAGLLKTLHVSPSITVYDTNTNPHFHFINDKTGEIFDIDCEGNPFQSVLDQAVSCYRDESQMRMNISGVEVIFRGSQN